MLRPARRRLPFADRFAALAIVLALAVRIVLPALHVHGADLGPTASAHSVHSVHSTAAELPCRCGHHHAAPTAGPSGDAPTGERVDAAVVGTACPCLACELEHGTPGAPPPDTGTGLPAGALAATVPAAATAAPATAAANGYASRAPPRAAARRSALG